MARRRSANDQRAFLVSDTPLRTSQYSILDQLDNIKRPDGLFELYFVVARLRAYPLLLLFFNPHASGLVWPQRGRRELQPLGAVLQPGHHARRKCVLARSCFASMLIDQRTYNRACPTFQPATRPSRCPSPPARSRSRACRCSTPLRATTSGAPSAGSRTRRRSPLASASSGWRAPPPPSSATTASRALRPAAARPRRGCSCTPSHPLPPPARRGPPRRRRPSPRRRRRRPPPRWPATSSPTSALWPSTLRRAGAAAPPLHPRATRRRGSTATARRWVSRAFMPPRRPPFPS